MSKFVQRQTALKCEWCHTGIQVTEEAVRLMFFEGETFLVHQYCALIIQNAIQKEHDEARKNNLIHYYCKKLSGG